MSKTEIPVLEGFVTVPEIAAATGLSRQYVSKLVSMGRFPGARRVGGGDRLVYVVPDDEADAFVAPFVAPDPQ